MREWIDKILVVIRECKDPIKDNRARNLRDDTLIILSQYVCHLERDEFESYARDENELRSLGWFYTRFIHLKKTSPGAGRNFTK